MSRSSIPQGSAAALVLIVGSLLWSLLGAGLQLLANAQLLVPLLDRLIAAPWFGYGRLVPASQFLLSFGWLGSGLLGVLLILAPRFSGIAFRYGRLLFGGALLWQLSILGGVTQILLEGPSGLIGLPQPRFVSILLLISFLILGTGLTRGLGRSWKSGPLLPRLYLLLGLLAFPLGLGSAEILLRGTSAPGSVQIITQILWHSFANHLWLAPLGLVLIFQLLPTLTGRAVSSLNLGLLGWAATCLLGGWLGTIRVSDGPIPSWMQSAGVVSAILMGIVALGNGLMVQNLAEGRWEEVRRNVALRFVAVGAWAYASAYLLLAFLALPWIRPVMSFTMAWPAFFEIFNFLFLGCVLAGAIYALLPVSREMGWPNSSALTWHFWCTTLGTTTTASCLLLAGSFQGLALSDSGVPISTLASYLRPFLFVVIFSQAAWLIGQMAFSAVLFSSLLRLFPAAAPMAVFRNPTVIRPASVGHLHG
jgi:cytochrome c oxidase cbb3-type subunit 1